MVFRAVVAAPSDGWGRRRGVSRSVPRPTARAVHRGTLSAPRGAETGRGKFVGAEREVDETKQCAFHYST